jgi:tetratricopeptide (TPR) repeat protein
LDTSRLHIKRGYRIARQIGDTFGMIASHVYAGDLAAVEERLGDAQENYEMSLRLEDTAPHSQFRAMLHRRLGTLFVLRGDPQSALGHHQNAFELSREVGDRRTTAFSLIEIGKDWRLIGDTDQARQNLLRGVRMSIELGLQPCLSRGLLELSHLALTHGDVTGARRLVSVLDDATLGDLQADYDALIVQLEGGEVASFAPITVHDMLNELIAAAEVDTLKL